MKASLDTYYLKGADMIDLSYGADRITQTSQSVTYRYRQVKRWAEKALPCPACGKKVRRRKTFEATVNPFNKNEDGSQRSPEQVGEMLTEQAAAWKLEPEAHQACLSATESEGS